MGRTEHSFNGEEGLQIEGEGERGGRGDGEKELIEKIIEIKLLPWRRAPS